jgi:O-acetyl-ADP-ribose deacetylase (regulator of RNase III)
MTAIRYVTGDATQPYGDGLKFIAHVCNDVGAWGSGFVLSLSARWPLPEEAYRAWHGGEHEQPFALGTVQMCVVERDVIVANMIAQRGVASFPGASRPPIRYRALQACLRNVGSDALSYEDASVHMPRIGCGLAGGRWDWVEPLVRQELCHRGIPVTVYDLPPGPPAPRLAVP